MSDLRIAASRISQIALGFFHTRPAESTARSPMKSHAVDGTSRETDSTARKSSDLENKQESLVSPNSHI